ncbi:MAG: hypothetical protein LBR80_14175 [Deltaproteobacteria bacterium]|nr:hypothetical protein [Deltaproteobacteria bacterium]
MIIFDRPFEDLVDELKALVSFKDDTLEGDVIAVIKEIASDKTAADYAQVAGFTADPTKRDEWWHVRLLFLSFPVVNVVFTLQAQHFTGKEIFTMGGRKVFIKALDPKAYLREGDDTKGDGGPGNDAKGGPPKGNPARPDFKLVR